MCLDDFNHNHNIDLLFQTLFKSLTPEVPKILAAGAGVWGGAELLQGFLESIWPPNIVMVIFTKLQQNMKYESWFCVDDFVLRMPGCYEMTFKYFGCSNE
jgi:hypothetical protein